MSDNGTHDRAVREEAATDDVVYSARLRGAVAEDVTATPLAEVGRRYSQRPEPKEAHEPEPGFTHDKLHPVLREALRSTAGDERQEAVIVLADPVAVPRFPALAPEPRDSEHNRAVHDQAQRTIRSLERERAPYYERLAADLDRYGARVVERFWLINAVVAELPLSAVGAIAERDDVVSVEPRYSGEAPPQDEVDDGRAVMCSDSYFVLGQSWGFIGLLDTGVRFTHTLFNNPSHIDFRRDCINGGTDCNTGTNLNPDDDCWNHGTSSAAIITGNGTQGDDFRGVTETTLDSFKVYPTANPCGGLDEAAAVRGFQAAVGVSDQVIVAEMQGLGDHESALARAADAAYDAGTVVIAANGNAGPGGSTVRCPANARRAIGVGNFDVQTLQQIESQSRGPTGDGRFKPDIQAPTNTETASNASDTARKIFGGTSGATPYAAGAATLLRNWLRGGPGAFVEPGQVYANLILSGQRPWVFDNTTGAGPLLLPADGHLWWGSGHLSQDQVVDLGFGGAASARTVDAAIWWPESGTHNDIDLYLIRGDGSIATGSTSVGSVFERCGTTTNPAGQWSVRLRGYHIPAGPQQVFYMAFQGT